MKIRTIATTLLTLAIGMNAARGDSITLKSSATLSPGVKTITLADVAELEGEHAQRLGSVVLQNLDENGKPITITVQQVRESLQTAGAHWGLIDLNGWKVEVRAARRFAGAPQAMTVAAIGETDLLDEPAEPRSKAVAAATLLRQRDAAAAIAGLLARSLEIDPTNLRLTFDEVDQPLLELPTSQYRFEFQPMSSLESNRIAMRVRAWRDGQIAKSASLSIGLEVRVETAVAMHDIRRGSVLAAGDARSESQWLDGSFLREVIDADALIGRIATTSMKQGDLIRLRDAKQETLIERGDVVQVRCLVGGVALAMQAEARADGAQGDMIEFRKLGERETFLARVSSRNEAIVDLTRN